MYGLVGWHGCLRHLVGFEAVHRISVVYRKPRMGKLLPRASIVKARENFTGIASAEMHV